jgi:uncharacterized protein
VISYRVPGLPFPLVADGAPASAIEVDGGTITLTSGPKSDLFIDPAGDGSGPDTGRFLGAPPAGDFTLRARASAGLHATFDAAVLLVYASGAAWAKLCLEYSPQGRPTVVTVVNRGTSDDTNCFEAEAASIRLRITRSGRAWAVHASADGSYWRLVRYFALGDGDLGLTA